MMTSTSVAPTYYLSSYSSTAGDLAALVWQQEVVLNVCTQVAADNSVYVIFGQDDVGYYIGVHCSSGCSGCTFITGLVDGYLLEDTAATTDNYYLLTS